MLADEHRLMRVPEGVDLAEAAAFVTTYGTSYHGLKERAALQPGETLLVLGAAGGVGLAAVELGKMMGAHVIAAASSPEKLALCREYGATDLIDYSREDLKERIKQITGGKGVDVIYDPLGGRYSEPALRGIAWKGRFLVIGFAAGEIPKIPLNLALLKGCAIIGVFYGAHLSRDVEGNERLVDELLELLRQKKLRPHISATYPLAEATRALNDLLERKVKGKAVLVTDLYRA
jgi:NADPH2:quinone reductase